MKAIFKSHKLALMLILAIIFLGIPLIRSENSEVRKLAMWLPFLVVIINAVVNYYQIKKVSTIFINLMSFPFVFFGFIWFMTFTFTDYRSHLAIIGIPIAIIFLIIGIVLLDKEK
ncbi:MAG: hypothetical protein U9O24_06135 [Campylobacterota bacterium]|nr:hypothetical protein [Campylobacterota bacterium]